LNRPEAFPQVERYISDFVVIGMPELYLHSRTTADHQ
jgi:hypothetical protein